MKELRAQEIVEIHSALERFYRCGTGIMELLLKAEHIACFYCLAHFTSAEYESSREGVLDGFCPRCEIDALIPEGLGLSLDDETLKLARHFQFNGYADDEGWQPPNVQAEE